VSYDYVWYFNNHILIMGVWKGDYFLMSEATTKTLNYYHSY